MNLKLHKKKLVKSVDSIYAQLEKPMAREKRLKVLKGIRLIDNLFELGKNLKDKDYKDSFLMWKRVRKKLLKALAKQPEGRKHGIHKK